MPIFYDSLFSMEKELLPFAHIDAGFFANNVSKSTPNTLYIR
jgi:hypothetical protein